jgi:hypothetical protein
VSGSRDGGRFSGHVVVGTVVSIDDPWQSGSVKVRFQVGSAVQDQLSDDDLPWSRVMFSSVNSSLKQVGGPHTGLQVGSRVYAVPVDGAGLDYLVIGSVVTSGTGEPDATQTPDSDVPTGTKMQALDSISQPRYGDINNVALDSSGGVIKTSIVDYARDRGGPEKRPAKFDDLPDTVGSVSAIA